MKFLHMVVATVKYANFLYANWQCAFHNLWSWGSDTFFLQILDINFGIRNDNEEVLVIFIYWAMKEVIAQYSSSKNDIMTGKRINIPMKKKNLVAE